MTGFVSIVGAGPGSPDLLTVRALRRLRRAELVIHDGLVPPAILRLAPAARHHSVSRRPGAEGPPPRDVVELMIEAVARGEQVVRLRAGDPFVFARGAEEALGLAQARVPFEIVPGLTTASAAPTFAGIPLTHRGVASAFVVVSGHAPDTFEPVLRGIAPATVTVVVLMGIQARAGIAAFLIARGWRPDTPAAIVSNASRREQRIWRGVLAELSTHRQAEIHPAPGVIVIGDVVEVGATIAAAMQLPPRDAVAHLVNPSLPSQEALWQP